MSRLARLASLTVAAVAAAAGPAAADWPVYGGDEGHSGLQALSDAAPPVHPLFSTATAGKPKTPPIITNPGPDGIARIGFGTEDGRVHVVKADSNGTRVGADTGVLIDDGPVDDTDTFTGLGGAGSQGLAFVSASNNLFVLHNDDNQDGTQDIAIAHVDANTAAKPGGSDFAIPGTDGLTVSGSPVLGSPDQTGTRALYFLAFAPEDCLDPIGVECTPAVSRLFRVAIGGADSSSPTFGPVLTRDVAGANMLAAPTLASIKADGVNAVGHVIVGTNSANTIQTFTALELTPGPKSADLGDTATAVSAQVGPGGLPAALSESLFVSVGQTGGAANDSSKVYRLTVANSALQVADQSHFIGGPPSPALALDRETDSGGLRVVAATSNNLAILDGGNLPAGVRLRFTDDLAGGTTGFRQNSPSVLGSNVYISRDNGEPLVLQMGNAQPVPSELFAANAAQMGVAATQPAIDGTLIAFTSDKGLFAYDATPASSANSPVLSASAPTTPESAGAMRFTVRMSRTTDRTVRFTYEARSGSAVAGTDFTPVSGTAEIPAGAREAAIDVPIVPDELQEGDETVTLALGQAQRAVIAAGFFTGTIADDDVPTASVSDASVREGDDGFKPMTFTVRLGAIPAGPVTVGWSTADDSARGGIDYDAALGEVRFEAGEREKKLTVAIRGDDERERSEVFHVDLYSIGGSLIGDGRGTGTIVDNDGPGTRDGRRRPAGLVIQLSPLVDTRAPYRFRIRGKLVKPRKVSRRRSCRGKVALTLGTGEEQLARRIVRLKSKTCRFTGVVELRRLPRGSRNIRALRAQARFRGNRSVRPISSPSLLARLD